MKVSVDVISRQVVGISLPASPFLFSVEVPSDFNITKTIQEEILPKIPLPLEEEVSNEEPQEEEVSNEEPQEEVVAEKKYSYRTVTFLSNPNEFTYEEVKEKKKAMILESSGKENIIHREFTSEASIDLTFPEHQANTGVKFVSILPFGKIKLKTIELISPATSLAIINPTDSSFVFYVNGELVSTITGKIDFEQEPDTLDIVIENFSDIAHNLEELTIVY